MAKTDKATTPIVDLRKSNKPQTESKEVKSESKVSEPTLKPETKVKTPEPPYVKTLNSIMNTYIKAMEGNITEKEYIAQQSNMFIQLVSILEESDYTLFKNKWNIINKHFKESHVLKSHKIYRFDYINYNGNSTSDRTMFNLLTILVELNDPVTRNEKRKSFDVSKAIQGVKLNSIAINNLTRYYS